MHAPQSTADDHLAPAAEAASEVAPIARNDVQRRGRRDQGTTREAIASMGTRVARVAAAALVAAGTISASEQSPPAKHDILPTTYRLADVEFEFAEGAARDNSSIRVDGSGHGVVTGRSALTEETRSPFIVEPLEVFRLLQLCYRGGFFDLQPTYGEPEHVRLRSDGTVETLTTVVADAVGSRVSVRIGEFKRSVTYLKGHGFPPPVVIELEGRIRELASTGKRSDAHRGR